MLVVDEPTNNNLPSSNNNTESQRQDTTMKQIDLKCRERVTDSDVEDGVYDYRKPSTLAGKDVKNKGTGEYGKVGW